MADVPWTVEQAAAIRAEGHTLLAASAGTGKTTTVIGKVLWHLGFDIGEDGNGTPIPPCPPHLRVRLADVAAITFTEKAAYDLKKKLRDAIERRDPALVWEIDRAAIGTIHGFCGNLLREHALRFGIDPSYTVLDERTARVAQDDLLRSVYLEALDAGEADAQALAVEQRFVGFQYTQGTLDHLREMFRDIRWHRARYDAWTADGGLDEPRLRALAPGWDDSDQRSLERCRTLYRIAGRAVERWETHEADEGVRDYDSLILAVRDLLQRPEGAAALASIRRRLKLFIIDEFQDTDGAQRDIAFAIAGLAGDGPADAAPHLVMVGDPKQSIYGFRGADVSVWSEVRAAIGAADGRVLDLTMNFRSADAVVDYVNATCASVMAEVGRSVGEDGARVDYVPLEPARGAIASEHVEWLEAAGTADERRTAEASAVAARIRDIVIDEDCGDCDGIQIVDPDTNELRDCRYRDVAILFRTRTALRFFEDALRHYGVPYYLAGDAALTKRQEVLDLLTALKVLRNPQDDLAAFALLRSPFVGLRDEVITRIRLEAAGTSLLQQARAFLETGVWFEAPEHPDIAGIERESLAAALDALDELTALRSRLPTDRLLETFLDRTGYRLHLRLLEHAEPTLANVQRVLQLLHGYRDRTIGEFLDIWTHWQDKDLGIPQAALYAKGDDVVTLSTIHAAKGLEWPVVFLVDSDGPTKDRCTNALWSDREAGPVLCPKQGDRGPRAAALAGRRNAEGVAEEARVTYVAVTRARDRLYLSGPRAKPKGPAEWLLRGAEHIRAFEDEVGDVEIPPLPPEPQLAWLGDAVADETAHPLVAPLRRLPARFTRSATEIMAWRRDRHAAALTYRHGVQPPHRFVRSNGQGRDGVPAHVRGTVIHDVLEQIRQEEELAELLDVAIGSLDHPELEERLAGGGAYRQQLEEEIRRVIRSPQWQWYLDGAHHRELWFVHFATPTKWHIGAFDLLRFHDDGTLIVDFKTHTITKPDVKAKAAEYALQAAVYTRAARITGLPPRFRLHFTHPNAVVEM